MARRFSVAWFFPLAMNAESTVRGRLAISFQRGYGRDTKAQIQNIRGGILSRKMPPHNVLDGGRSRT